MLSPEQQNELKQILMDEKKDLEHRLKENDDFDIENALNQESIGELSNYDNHPADHGSELFEREKDIALLEHEEEHLQDILRALKAMEEGTYGVCEICNQPIPEERLQALPTATRCIEHTPNHFVSENRPVEEDILRPGFGKFEYDEQDATLYDAEDAWQEVARYGTSETPSDFWEQEKNHYNEMFVESDEPIGLTEAVEGFLLADIEGNFIGIAANDLHEIYERKLDEAGIMSTVGGLGAPTWDYDDE
ncbi:yteA family sporulation protein [Ammoniphilus sp. YIM 78166]|uniref:yteA family sporulation protein n=1 Tax=Ammoniphilus sp. YIM 78166 TaxID=1644106 RepID=UPI0010705BA8|nr:yteA family sporulation protein [Ammoniphilus sp. YIM 78166]